MEVEVDREAGEADRNHNREQDSEDSQERRIFGMREADGSERALETVSKVDPEDQAADDVDGGADGITQNVMGVVEGKGAFGDSVAEFKFHVAEMHDEEEENHEAGGDHEIVRREEEESEGLLGLFFGVGDAPGGVVGSCGGEGEDQMEEDHREEADFGGKQEFAAVEEVGVLVVVLRPLVHQEVPGEVGDEEAAEAQSGDAHQDFLADGRPQESDDPKLGRRPFPLAQDTLL